MRHIACCSMGKDSLAQIVVGVENGEIIDEVLYSEVMFTPEISGEIPEHRDFIYNVAIPKLENEYGLKVTVVRSDKTMWDDFHTLRIRGANKGLLRGFPIPAMCNINRDLKMPPIRKYISSINDTVIQYVGIAADEVKRLARLDGKTHISLLAKYGITEEMAVQICKDHGLLSPIYEFTTRNGCFFCPNSNMTELRHLYDHHPDLWAMLRELQNKKTSRRNFTREFTVHDIESTFELEDAQIMFDI